MNQLKLFVTGQKPLANGLALGVSIGLAGYCQYKCQKNDEEIDTTLLEDGAKPMAKCGMKKYMLWALVVLFMIPFVIASLDNKRALSPLEPVGSFQTRVAESASSLRDRSDEGDFKQRVADAASQLRSQIAASSASLPDNMSVDDTSSDVAIRAGDEIRRFLAENP